MEFYDWTTLASYAGSLGMVLIITQFTKEIKIIKRIPTQLWSYIVAVFILSISYYFTGRLNWSNAVLIMFNAMVVALSANGGFEFVSKTFPGLFDKDNEKK